MTPTNVLDAFSIRLYYGNEDDEAVAKYLAQFNAAAKGVKHNRAKTLLYLGLQALEGEASSHVDEETIRRVIREEMRQISSPLDQRAVRQAVREALDETADEETDRDFTLSDVRRVMEVTLTQELDRRQLASSPEAPAVEAEEKQDVEGEAEIESALDRIAGSASGPLGPGH
jgi:hypothetical protein